MRWSLVAFALAGCATAEKSTFGTGPGEDSGVRLLDSNPMPIDAARFLDAPPNGMTSVTLTQTTNNTIAAGTSLACGGCKAFDAMLNCIDYRTNENAYYRVFKMSDYGVTGTLHVKQVTFGVQEAGGTQSVQVKIGSYAGTPGTTLNVGANDWAGGNVTPINSTIVNVAATTTGTTLPAPITGDVPLGYLIVEVFSPAAAVANTYFFLGASTSGETTPGFIRAPSSGCAINNPTTPAALNLNPPSMSQFIITVSGTY